MLSLVVQRLRASVRWTWPQTLLAAYGFTFFLHGITRYKNLILILMLGTAFVMIWRGQAKLKPLLGAKPILALLFLVLTVGYGCLISPDPELSLRDANQPILIDSLIVGLLWPIVLQGSTREGIAKALIVGFIGDLVALLVLDLHQYWSDYVSNGIVFGSQFNHRELSYGLLATIPFALVGLRERGRLLYGACMVLLILAGTSLVGTLARGAWLAALVIGVVWVWRYRDWKSVMLVMLVATGIAGISLAVSPQSTLAFKLHQTDGSQRWGGGVQTATMDLILENPIRGYGFGDEIYASVYNRRAPIYPNWTVRESIGPHNMTLRMWFGCGILGLAGILAVYLAVVLGALGALRRNSGIAGDAVFALLLVFLGAVFVRGLFESAYMNYFGWIIGTLVAIELAPSLAEKLPS